MGDGGWHLSSKTICPVCGEKIKRGRDSYTCGVDGVPKHFNCVYRPGEMAVTNGEEEHHPKPARKP